MKNLKPLLFLGVVAVVYLCMVPWTVQSGDTGELVTNSYMLRVSHPPGYPLWTLLYHIPVKYLSFGNPFKAAAVFTVVISIITFGILGFVVRNTSAWFIVALLSSSALIWKYSLLPDVFGLHMMFLSLVFAAFLRSELLNKWWMIFLISLSVAHHHTIVFVFPMFVYAILESKLSLKKVYICLISGLVSFSLYLCLFAFHTEDYGSWGNLKSFNDLIHHFLRRDYGTFNLLPEDKEGVSWIGFFSEHFLKEAWGLALVLGYFVIKERDLLKENLKKISAVLLCFILYFLVFSMQSLTLNGEYEAVIERFLIQPLLIIAFISFLLIYKSGKDLPKVLLLILLVNIGLNVQRNYRYVNFSEKTIVEDHIKNAMKDIPEGSVFHASGDTFGFGAYYLHDVMGFRKDIKLIHPNRMYDWSIEKASKVYPEIFRSNFDKKASIILALDLDKVHFYTNMAIPILPVELGATLEGLKFRIYPKNKRELPLYLCHADYIRRSRPEIEDLKRFEINAFLDQFYGSCDFGEGVAFLKSNEPEKALLSFHKAVSLSPLNARYWERLCFVKKQLNHSDLEACNQKLEELLMNTSEQYYLNKYSL